MEKDKIDATYTVDGVNDDLVLRYIPDDPVNHPSHYTSGKYECIDVMEEQMGREAVMDFCLCNAFKYLWRFKGKGGTEDIRKAVWYLEHYLLLEDRA